MRFRIRGSARHQILIIVCPTSFLSPLMLPTAATAYQQPVQSRLHNDLRPRTLPTNRIAHGVQPSTVLRPVADSIAVSRASSLANAPRQSTRSSLIFTPTSILSNRRPAQQPRREVFIGLPYQDSINTGTSTCMYHRTDMYPSFHHHHHHPSSPCCTPQARCHATSSRGASPTSTRYYMYYHPWLRSLRLSHHLSATSRGDVSGQSPRRHNSSTICN